MPTIKQLPVATSVAVSDLLPISQGGTTRGLAVGGLLSSTQPAISLVSGKLLGRVSTTAGGPEPVGVGSGLAVAAGVIAATGDDHTRLPISTSLLAGDEVVVNSAGSAKRMAATSLRNLFTAGTGVSIDGSGTISAGAAITVPATGSTLGGVKIGPGLSVGVDGTLTALAPSTADASVAGMAVSLLYENSTHPINAEGGIWSNTPYAYLGVSRDFDASVGGTGPRQFGGGNGGPVSALFVYANNTGTASDCAAIIGDSVARVNNASAFGGNLIARGENNLTGLHLVGLELDVEPTPTGSVTSGSGLAINAFSQRMPIPAIQIGGLGGGRFGDGLVIDAVTGAGVGAETGAAMTSFVNTVNGAYSDAAIVLGYQHRIHMYGADGTSAYLSSDGGFMHFVCPTNGYLFRDKTDTFDLAGLNRFNLTLNVGLAVAGAAVVLDGATSVAVPTVAAGTASTLAASTAFVNTAISALTSNAPGTLNTLGKIAAQLASDESAAAALTTAVSGKLSRSANLSDLASVSAARSNLGLATVASSGTYSDLSGAPALPVAASTTPAADGTGAVGGSLAYARADHVHPSDPSRAPLASPGFIGAPTAPTAAAGTSTTQLATTQFALSAASIPVFGISASGTSQSLAAASSGSKAYDITLTANCALSLSGGTAGQQQSMTVYLRQDSAAGRIVTLPSGVKWPGGTPPTPGAAAGNVDVFVFTTPDGGTTWFGSY